MHNFVHRCSLPSSWLDSIAPRITLSTFVLFVALCPPELGPSVLARALSNRMSPRLVETQYGKVHGILLSRPGRNLPQVEAFLGLQYASILGGELRFMPPTSSMEKWDGIRVAMKFRPVCPQRVPDLEELRKRLPAGRVEHFKRLLPFLEKQEEECLNLNIYVPVTGKVPKIVMYAHCTYACVCMYLCRYIYIHIIV